MSSRIVSIAKQIIPKKITSWIVLSLVRRREVAFLQKLQKDILAYYAQQPQMSDEQKTVINYLKKNPVTVFPYEFREKYNKNEIEVHLDATNNLRFVWHEGKKLYFKKSLSDAAIRSLYHGLQLDQDSESPHLYLTENFNLSADDCIADIGAAEGNFTLSNIEKVKKVFLFEYDPEWIEALQATFAPWKDKVVICDKYVSNYDSPKTIALDSFANKDEITFLKVDIEGEEHNFLEGAHSILSQNKKLKIAICTYHKQNDETEFTQTLSQLGYDVQASEGYMIFIFDKSIRAPFLRRGLLRAVKAV